MVARLASALALLFCASCACARTPTPDPSASTRLIFEDHQSLQLTATHSRLLDEMGMELARLCGEGWASRSGAGIRVYLAPNSLPRRDYDLMWHRADRAREYIKKFDVPTGWLQVIVSDPPFGPSDYLGGDHFVEVGISCSRRKR